MSQGVHVPTAIWPTNTYLVENNIDAQIQQWNGIMGGGGGGGGGEGVVMFMHGRSMYGYGPSHKHNSWVEHVGLSPSRQTR